MSWIWRLLGAILIWVIVGLVVAFLATLLLTVKQEQINALGGFLEDNAYLIGFLAGAAYFVWGRLPGRFGG